MFDVPAIVEVMPATDHRLIAELQNRDIRRRHAAHLLQTAHNRALRRLRQKAEECQQLKTALVAVAQGRMDADDVRLTLDRMYPERRRGAQA